MSEITVNKKGTILDEEENFKPIHDNFRFYDHFSKFSGLAVAQLYLICAAVTLFSIRSVSKLLQVLSIYFLMWS